MMPRLHNAEVSRNDSSDSLIEIWGTYSICITTGMSTLPTPRAHVTPRRFCSPRLRLGSGRLTLLTRRSAVKTHLTINRQVLTRGPEDVPSSQTRGPESVTTMHFKIILIDEET
jgi:hypothetical protein